MLLSDIDKRVGKGIKLLDEKCPNWRKKIDWDKLDIMHPQNCILGQLYGDYIRGLDNLGLFDEDKSVWCDPKYGFVLTSVGENYSQLTNYWKELGINKNV